MYRDSDLKTTIKMGFLWLLFPEDHITEGVISALDNYLCTPGAMNSLRSPNL